jgi:hypothetical protein
LADQIKVKKVSAYPIPAKIKLASGEMPAAILKIAQQGFICEINDNKLQPGERFECTFELPVIHHLVTDLIVAVKIYNQWSGGGTPAGGAAPHAPASGSSSGAASSPSNSQPGTIQHLAEFHFVQPSPTTKDAIGKFLKLLGGKKL